MVVGLIPTVGYLCSCFTVPFHSIQQSRVTGLLKMLKCRSCHGSFHGVPNSFWQLCHQYIIFFIACGTQLPKFWTSHSNLGGSPKPKFRQVHHVSRALPNWLKWDSILHILETTPWSLRCMTQSPDSLKESHTKTLLTNFALTHSPFISFYASPNPPFD
jgi:hypothetical protein